ncbi:hypothetical protein AVEN_181-1 [Araneus ventricosus]|uniref:Uncharacterized protein n=1 Tax=Araneus ventricosus TaxID=182803 RepID=A0A4Y2D4D1_ARAVE|nr:hypothetical protein AVEN_181-1 [Araneus ventricosus]
MPFACGWYETLRILMQPNMRVSSLKRLDWKFVPRSVIIVAGHPTMNQGTSSCFRSHIWRWNHIWTSSKSINNVHTEFISVRRRERTYIIYVYVGKAGI